MKIVFICGSMEPGKDGVGDYTRRLAAELIRQGNQVTALAIYDRNIQGIQKDRQKQEEIYIPVLRLGADKSSRDRFFNASKWLNEHNPEWVSLQFVPFSFQKKGLPWQLGTKLAKLGRGRKWHIMFHELWVGMDTAASFKHTFWGKTQQHIIKAMIASLAPECIHTQTPLYKSLLHKMGCNARLLPLFGNINPETKSAGLNDDFVNIAVFGGIHYGAKLESFLQWLKQKDNYRYYFHFIGGNGAERDNWMEILKENEIDYKVHGWLPEKAVSLALSNCQWSVTSTPYYLIEKSGAVAVMLEHNLNVINIAREWVPKKINTAGLTGKNKITKWSEFLNFDDFKAIKRQPAGSGLKEVAENFTSHLNKNKHYGSTRVSLE